MTEVKVIKNSFNKRKKNSYLKPYNFLQKNKKH